MTGSRDYERLLMVIKPQGGIFEACQPYSGSHFGPDSYESKLPVPDLRAIESFLKELPPSDAEDGNIRFIISFLKDGNWLTRTYSSLSANNPLQPILGRMIQQSALESGNDSSQHAEFLAPGS